MKPARIRAVWLWSVAAVGWACAGGGSDVALEPAPLPAVDSVDIRLFLVGDAGAPHADGEPVLAALSADVASQAERSVVVYLGDNLYPDGLPAETDAWRAEGERRLDAQLAVARTTGARAFFVPGNHDWGHGWEGVRRQEAFVESRGQGRVALVPDGGCPGPAVADLGAALRLVALDTQWWLEDGPKPIPPDAACPATRGTVMDSLRGALRDAGARRVVVVAHHPMESGGPHGGRFGWKDHIFPLRRVASWLWLPLPVIGSAYPLYRTLNPRSQDLPSGIYESLRDSLRSAFGDHPPLVYAGGHEHNLQIMTGTVARYLVVSGSGIYGHTNAVGRLDRTLYAVRAAGYVRLDVLRNGRTRLAVVRVNRDGERAEVFSIWLD